MIEVKSCNVIVEGEQRHGPLYTRLRLPILDSNNIHFRGQATRLHNAQDIASSQEWRLARPPRSAARPHHLHKQ